MASWGAKTIVLEHKAQTKADSVCESNPWFEDAFFALQWLLARTPDLGVDRHDGDNGYKVYRQESDPIARTPEIWVLYSETENEVIFWDINIVEHTENPS